MPLKKPLAALIAAAVIVTGPGFPALNALAVETAGIKGTGSPVRAQVAPVPVNVGTITPSAVEFARGVDVVQTPAAGPIAAAGIAPEMAPVTPLAALGTVPRFTPEAAAAAIGLNRLAADPAIATLTAPDPGVGTAERSAAADKIFSNADKTGGAKAPAAPVFPEAGYTALQAAGLDRPGDGIVSESQPIPPKPQTSRKAKTGFASELRAAFRAAGPIDYAAALAVAATTVGLAYVAPTLSAIVFLGTIGMNIGVLAARKARKTLEYQLKSGAAFGLASAALGAILPIPPALAAAILGTWFFTTTLKVMTGGASTARRAAGKTKDGAASASKDALTVRAALPGNPSPLHPTVVAEVTDGHVIVSVANGNTVEISAGFGYGPEAFGGTIGLKVGARRFAVTTKPGDYTKKKLKELKALIEAGGYTVTETVHPAKDTIELTWVIDWRMNRGKTE